MAHHSYYSPENESERPQITRNRVWDLIVLLILVLYSVSMVHSLLIMMFDETHAGE